MCWLLIDGLVQERRNSIANALELRLSCTWPIIMFLSSAGSKPNDVKRRSSTQSNSSSGEASTLMKKAAATEDR